MSGKEARPWQSPPVKVLASQLRRCCRRRASPGGPWLLGREERGLPPLPVPLVWMQGTVEEEEEEEEGRLRLRDGSGAGSFVVLGASGVPQGRPCLLPGKYVMVLGLVQAVGPEPILRALKVTDLSGNPLNRSMWEMEVEDLHRNLLLPL